MERRRSTKDPLVERRRSVCKEGRLRLLPPAGSNRPGFDPAQIRLMTWFVSSHFQPVFFHISFAQINIISSIMQYTYTKGQKTPKIYLTETTMSLCFSLSEKPINEPSFPTTAADK